MDNVLYLQNSGTIFSLFIFRTPHELGVKKRRHQKRTKGGRKRVLYPDISLDTHFFKRNDTLQVLRSVVRSEISVKRFQKIQVKYYIKLSFLFATYILRKEKQNVIH